MRTMMTLLVHPPTEEPAAVRQQLDETGRDRARTGAKFASVSYLSLCLYVPFLVWMGVRSWPMMLVLYGTVFLIAAVTFAASRMARQGSTLAVVAISLNALVVAATTTVAGPFLVAPGFAAATSLALALHFDSHRTLAAILGCLAVLGPFALERLGVLPASYLFSTDGMSVMPRMLSLPEGPTLLFLGMTSITTIGITTYVAARMRDALTDAERRLVLHAWQLQQVVRDTSCEAQPESRAPMLRTDSDSGGETTERQGDPPSGRGADACLTEERVLEWVSGGMSAAKLARVDAHIDTCESCRQLLSALAKTGSP